MRILVVDHHRGSRIALAALLRDEGHLVLESLSRASTLEHCVGGGIDIVVLGLEISDIEGLRLLDEVKAMGLQVIVVSGSCYQLVHRGAVRFYDYRDEVLDRGAAAYFPKPIQFEELVVCIHGLARRTSSDPHLVDTFRLASYPVRAYTAPS